MLFLLSGVWVSGWLTDGTMSKFMDGEPLMGSDVLNTYVLSGPGKRIARFAKPLA